MRYSSAGDRSGTDCDVRRFEAMLEKRRTTSRAFSGATYAPARASAAGVAGLVSPPMTHGWGRLPSIFWFGLSRVFGF